MKWSPGEDEVEREVVAPLSLIVTAFSAVDDVRNTWTPQIRTDIPETTLLVLFDLSGGCRRLGGSALAQVFNSSGSETPDVEDPKLLRTFFAGCQEVRRRDTDIVLAYHDRSDGGVIITVAEMCFAGHAGATVEIDANVDEISFLFTEELEAVVQVRETHLKELVSIYQSADFPASFIHVISLVNANKQVLSIRHNGQEIFAQSVFRL